MKDYTVTADFLTLIEQASSTTEDYMTRAIKSIDAAFGKGYAKEHPELVGQMVQAAATDFSSSVNLIISQEMQLSIDGLTSSIGYVP